MPACLRQRLPGRVRLLPFLEIASGLGEVDPDMGVITGLPRDSGGVL